MFLLVISKCCLPYSSFSDWSSSLAASSMSSISRWLSRATLVLVTAESCSALNRRLKSGREQVRSICWVDRDTVTCAVVTWWLNSTELQERKTCQIYHIMWLLSNTNSYKLEFLKMWFLFFIYVSQWSVFHPYFIIIYPVYFFLIKILSFLAHLYYYHRSVTTIKPLTSEVILV